MKQITRCLACGQRVRTQRRLFHPNGIILTRYTQIQYLGVVKYGSDMKYHRCSGLKEPPIPYRILNNDWRKNNS